MPRLVAHLAMALRSLVGTSAARHRGIVEAPGWRSCRGHRGTRLAATAALAIAVAVTVGCVPRGASERGGPARRAGAAARAGDAGRPLRVVTFNLLHGGPWSEWTGDDQGLERRFEMVAKELAALDPDIVALQEASVGWRRGNVAERLARRLGLDHVHAPATEHVFVFRLLGRAILSVIGFREGPAILSRFPIVASEVIDLPRCRRWWEPRLLLSATLRMAHGDLLVYSTHTSRDDCQLDRVREVVAARSNGLPSLLMGDLNTPETMQALAAFAEAGFLDAFRAANADADGATVWQRVTAPVATTSRRVDYILLLPGDTARGRVIASRVVLKTPARDADRGTLWPSDHHGVLAEISLAAPRAARAHEPLAQAAVRVHGAQRALGHAVLRLPARTRRRARDAARAVSGTGPLEAPDVAERRPEQRPGCPGALASAGGLGGPSRPPMKSVW